MALNVGINGFGRIGRIIFRTCFQNPGLNVSAINDPAVDIDYICYLIKFDSTHGKFKGTVVRSENEISIDGHKIAIFREKLPTNIPWQLADVQYVVEASGMFTSLEKASGHLTSDGVKRVLVTAPSLDVPMVVLGVNDDKLNTGHKVISCASSTLYCLAPIIKILEDQFGVSEGFITSIHAMTPSLKPLDGLCLKGKHWRDHRSIHQNIIPATTGACRALGKIIPEVKDKMTGLAFRVPIVNVSVLDISVRLKSNTSMECIRRHVENAGNFYMQNIIKVSEEQAVSSDFTGDTFSCILDLDSSLQLTPEFFKLICWYENEYSYACRIIDSIFFLERQYQLEWKSKMSYIRPTPKQSLIQQRECHSKFTYHQACSHECHSNPKSLCSTSQDSGFKSPKRPLFTKKTVSPRHFSSRQLAFDNKDTKKKNELFKIWNDGDEIVKKPIRNDKNSFFHSCVAITPQLNTNECQKTRERLENVKKEFSKMVIMTENLLKQSQHSKIEIELSEVASCDVGDANIEKINLCDEIKFSLDKDNQYIAIESNNNSKENKENENDCIILNSDENNKYQFGDGVNLINNANKTENYNNEINNYKVSYSVEDLKIVSFSPTSTNTDHDNIEKNKLDNSTIPDASIGLILNNDKITEKIIMADNNNIPVLITKSTFKEQDVCENHAVDATPLVTNNENRIGDTLKDKSSPNKSLEQVQKTNCSETKQCESFTPVSVNAKDKDVPERIDTNKCTIPNTDSQDVQGLSLQVRLESVLKKLAIDSKVVSGRPSTCLSSVNTVTTASNRDIKHKQDIYDKLDSVSATDSENSFHMKERKSQVINITDLTNSLEDLEQLDKICRIMEISDELSDQLLSTLNNNEYKEIKNKKWSFKDLCEKIKLDDFCNKMFSKSSF